jgi:hypothetical protein
MGMNDSEMYRNISALCRAKKLDKKRIVVASALGLPGFNPNGTIHWPTAEPALTAHAAEIDARLAESKTMQSLRRQKLQEEVERLRLENAIKARQTVDVDEMGQWLSQFGSELSAKARTIRKNLLDKCPEYRDVIEAEFATYFATIKNRADDCPPIQKP